MIHYENISKEKVDIELLLSADPDEQMVLAYLEEAFIYNIIENRTIIGCLVLKPLSKDRIEFKNISIYETYQRQGYGQQLIRFGIDICKSKGFQTAIIGTGNSSIAQLYLYQKMGFEMIEIRHNFFIEHYPEPIFENGIQCKHMVLLQIELQ